ncbi:MAG: hypothetical protein IID41_17800 [Planctomycetes bacterium]|nr:hypothetical protein [Planctomycetota bacterium]
MNSADQLLLFNVTNSLIQVDLKKVEDELGIDLGLATVVSEEDVDDYYPQVSASIRAEAAEMAGHYELFYCLENFIRDTVSAQLLAAEGDSWWEKLVPEPVKDNVKKNMQREEEAGITVRSQDLIDYATFGVLSQIIQANWDVFNDTFNNKKATSRVLFGLNMIRGPIAHCSPLASDEISRLRLALKDFFRLME